MDFVDVLDLEILRALVAHFEMVEIIKANYVDTTDQKDRVRCNEVAQLVADSLKVENSPTFRSRVRRAAVDAGFSRIVTTDHRPHYKFIKRNV